MPPYFKEAESWDDLAQASKSFPEDFLFDVQKATAAFPDILRRPPDRTGKSEQRGVLVERVGCKSRFFIILT
jgi:hypothetical protein